MSAKPLICMVFYLMSILICAVSSPIMVLKAIRYVKTSRSQDLSKFAMTKEYRSFDFMSPWEGAKYVLPGDEKGAE